METAIVNTNIIFLWGCMGFLIILCTLAVQSYLGCLTVYTMQSCGFGRRLTKTKLMFFEGSTSAGVPYIKWRDVYNVTKMKKGKCRSSNLARLHPEKKSSITSSFIWNKKKYEGKKMSLPFWNYTLSTCYSVSCVVNRPVRRTQLHIPLNGTNLSNPSIRTCNVQVSHKI